jgi:hypothetical protein
MNSSQILSAVHTIPNSSHGMVFIIIWVKITLSTGLNFSCYDGIFRLLWSSFHHLIRVNCKSLKYRIYSKEAKKSPCPTPAVAVTVIPISIAAAVGRCHSPCRNHQGRNPHRLIAACVILAPLIHPVSSCSQRQRGVLGHPGVSRVLSRCRPCIPCLCLWSLSSSPAPPIPREQVLSAAVEDAPVILSWSWCVSCPVIVPIPVIAPVVLAP